MTTSVFLDSDILFNFLAINPEKKEKYISQGTTGNSQLDRIIKAVMKILEKEGTLSISNFSVLELICTINRLKSSHKIPQIVKTLSNVCKIFPINDILIEFAWFFGANYKLHSGDALHVAFCLFNNIDYVFIKDDDFHASFIQIKEDYEKKGIELLKDFLNQFHSIKKIQEEITKKFENIKTIQIKQIK
ncbi:MAG: PIN domain-containing protein [Promethearchaeota archaeon]|nr:MAG: PIN domain-containing protein [Candidatus Lokiarchaeota archaeon]